MILLCTSLPPKDLPVLPYAAAAYARASIAANYQEDFNRLQASNDAWSTSLCHLTVLAHEKKLANSIPTDAFVWTIFKAYSYLDTLTSGSYHLNMHPHPLAAHASNTACHLTPSLTVWLEHRILAISNNTNHVTHCVVCSILIWLLRNSLIIYCI